MGERSPHNDPASRGAFVGLRIDTPRASLTQAVLEGVAFAIRDCVEIARAQGVKIKASTLAGGGGLRGIPQRAGLCRGARPRQEHNPSGRRAR